MFKMKFNTHNYTVAFDGSKDTVNFIRNGKWETFEFDVLTELLDLAKEMYCKSNLGEANDVFIAIGERTSLPIHSLLEVDSALCAFIAALERIEYPREQ